MNFFHVASVFHALLWRLFSLLLFILKFADGNSNEDPAARAVVETSYGRILGKLVDLGIKDLPPVEQFLGVPYGEAPQGSKRFWPTQNAPKWTRTTKDCTRLPPVCLQNFPDLSDPFRALKRMPRERYEFLKRLQPFLQDQREDCLYMNLYVPSNRGTDPRRKLPFLVIIHGDSYEWNSGNPYDGSILSSYGQMIVVTLNYRLGALGFLSSGDSALYGNRGLQDIVAALHMIRSIGTGFGGDTSKITLLGWGTGGALVTHLMTSTSAQPVSMQLFHRAIVLSGSALSQWSLVENPRELFFLFAQKIGCVSLSPSPVAHSAAAQLSSSPISAEAILDCLREQSLANISRAQRLMPKPVFQNRFGPVIDGSFVTREPEDSIQQQNGPFLTYDLMIGLNRYDAFNLLPDEDIMDGVTVENRDRIYRSLVRSYYKFHRSEIYDAIVNRYTNWSQPSLLPENLKEEVLSVLSDALYAAPVIRTAQHHAKTEHSSPGTWFYVFSHRSKLEHHHSAGPPPLVKGTISNEDLPYLLGYPMTTKPGLLNIPFNFSSVTTRDKLISEILMRFVSNFVKSGDPNIPVDPAEFVIEGNSKIQEKLRHQKWPAFDSGYDQYMNIGERPKPASFYRASEVSFWADFLPRLNRRHDQSLSAVDQDYLPRHRDMTSYFGEVEQLGGYFSGLLLPPTIPPPTTTTSKAAQTTTERNSNNADLVQSTVAVAATAGDTSQFTYSTILSITVVVGCALLVLNLLMFAGVYRQRAKQKKLRKHQLQHMQLHYQDYDASPGSPFLHSPVTPNAAQGNHVPPPPPPPKSTVTTAGIIAGDILSHHSTISNNTSHTTEPSTLLMSNAKQVIISNHTEHEPLLSPRQPATPRIVSPACPRHGVLKTAPRTNMLEEAQV